MEWKKFSEEMPEVEGAQYLAATYDTETKEMFVCDEVYTLGALLMARKNDWITDWLLIQPPKGEKK